MQIEKSSDGVARRLEAARGQARGERAGVYERDGIERWLEDDHRVWRATDFQRKAPDGTAVPITLDLWDEDSFVYGDNDQGDIEPNDRRKRLSLAYVPGHRRSARGPAAAAATAAGSATATRRRSRT